MSIKIRINRYYKRALTLTGVTVGLVLSANLANLAFASGPETDAPTESGQHLISIHDRGVEKVIVTKGATIAEALKAADIEVDAKRDVVEPALETELVASKYNVNIYRAKPVTIIDGVSRVRVITANQTPTQIARAAEIDLYAEDEATISGPDELLIDGPGAVMTISRSTPVKLTLYGKVSEIRTMAKTVGELLDEKKIKPGKDDTLSVGRDQKITQGMHIELWRNGKQTVTVEEEVDFPVEKIHDANREVGYREVKEAGQKGERNVTYEIEMRNGKEVSRKEIASVTTKHPKKQVEVVGTKNNYSGSLNEWLLALRTCETHGNYQAATGNGYYGAYQFLPSTWNSIANRTGRGDLVGVRPDQANPADQDAMVIANANATSGLSTQHPGCYKKLGLANKPPAQ